MRATAVVSFIRNRYRHGSGYHNQILSKGIENEKYYFILNIDTEETKGYEIVYTEPEKINEFRIGDIYPC